jgi:hypothetical protein
VLSRVDGDPDSLDPGLSRSILGTLPATSKYPRHHNSTVISFHIAPISEAVSVRGISCLKYAEQDNNPQSLQTRMEVVESGMGPDQSVVSRSRLGVLPTMAERLRRGGIASRLASRNSYGRYGISNHIDRRVGHGML